VFLKNNPIEMERIKKEYDIVTAKLKEVKRGSEQWWKTFQQERDLKQKWEYWRGGDTLLKQKINSSENVDPDAFKEFEISNLVRLGIIKEVRDTYAPTQNIDLPRRDPEDGHQTLKLDINMELELYYILTPLGELFLNACSLKHPMEDKSR
jgi:hypothetical protein